MRAGSRGAGDYIVIVPIVLLLALLVLNGVLAMSELAMMTSRQSRLAQAANQGSKGAAAAIMLRKDPTRFLSTVQIGITLIGVLAGALGEKALSDQLEAALRTIPAIADHADQIALVVVVLVITYVSLVLGELIPKRIAMAFPEAIAGLIALPLTLLSRVTALPVKVLSVSTDVMLRLLRVPTRRGDDDVSEDDVRALLARAASTGVFDPLEHKLFQRALRVGDLRVSELMVHRSDIVWIDESQTLDELRVLIGTNPYSQFPVCRGDLDTLVGVIHVKDLIAYGLLGGASFSVSQVARKPLFVPESTPALKMLEEFQRSKVHMAFVVDEFGGTQGLLTVNDVVGSLLGDVSLRSDASMTQLTKREDGTYLCDGLMPLHELVVALSISEQAESELPDVNTVAGLALSVIGHIPKAGEVGYWRDLKIEVLDMDGRRIDKVLVTRQAPRETDPLSSQLDA
jgi:putative hemolysin